MSVIVDERRGHGEVRMDEGCSECRIREVLRGVLLGLTVPELIRFALLNDLDLPSLLDRLALALGG